MVRAADMASLLLAGVTVPPPPTRDAERPEIATVLFARVFVPSLNSLRAAVTLHGVFPVTAASATMALIVPDTLALPGVDVSAITGTELSERRPIPPAVMLAVTV